MGMLDDILAQLSGAGGKRFFADPNAYDEVLGSSAVMPPAEGQGQGGSMFSDVLAAMRARNVSPAEQARGRWQHDVLRGTGSPSAPVLTGDPTRAEKGIDPALDVMPELPKVGMLARNYNPFPEEGTAQPAGTKTPITMAQGNPYPESGLTNDLPPATNDPTSAEPVVWKGGVPVPRPRPILPGEPATDASSADKVPTGAPLSFAPAAAPAAGPAPAGGLDIMGKLNNFLRPENAPLLMAMAGGFGGAGSIGTGMKQAFSAAAPAMMQNIQLQQKLGSQSALYKSLIKRGVPESEAMAAALDPNMLKIVGTKYFETKPFQHMTRKDALGNEEPIAFDPNTRKFFDSAGREIKPDSDGSTTLGAAQVFAPGVTKLDPTKTGDEMLAQYHPDVVAAVHAYRNGDVMPTGNPRARGIADLAKRIAIRWGHDTNTPVSDSLYNEKRVYRNELGSDRAGTAGGQVKAFQQGIEHAHGLTKAIERLGNSEGFGIPSIARGVNWLRQAWSTTQSGKASEVENIGQTLAGEVGKLFSGSAGGGVHERELTRQRFDSVKSPTELAAALDATLETMEGGLRALEQSRDRKLGPGVGPEFVTAATRQHMAEIKETIRRLREGVAAPAAAAPAAGKTSTNVPFRVLQ